MEEVMIIVMAGHELRCVGVICPYQYDNVELAFGRAGQCGTVATSENELYQYHADCTGRR